jgi:integrase
MAVIQKRGESYRVLIRKKGHAPISQTFKLKAVAERWARETEVALDAGKFQHKTDDATLGQTIDKYFERMKQIGTKVGENKTSTLNIIKREIGDKRLVDLNTDALVTYISGKKTISPSTRHQYIIFLRTCLKTAEALWDAQPDMTSYEKAVRFLRTHGLIGESNQRDVRVTDAQIITILGECKTSLPMDDIIWFQIHSAFRIGETCRLRWADLDEEKRTVLIRQRKHPRKKYDEISPLLGSAWDIVQRQPRGGEFIFPHKPDTIKTVWERSMERLGLEDIRIHDLRHEAISRLIERGYSIAEVQLCSGHKDLKSFQRYLKLRPEDLHDGPIAHRQGKPNLKLVA